MKNPHIIVRRHPYEEPYHTQIEIIASNGKFTASTDIYCGVEELKEIGEALREFAKTSAGEYCYEYGSEDPNERSYRYFAMKAYKIDSRGACALQIQINQNESEPEEGIAKFSIQSNSTDISDLGALFIEFSQLKHLEMHWSLDKKTLHESKP